MDFEITKQQQAIVDQVRDFTAKRLRPGVVERDEASEFPLEAFKEFGKMGMFGLCYPKAFGGSDVGYLPYILAVEEVSKVDASFGIGFSVNTSLYGRHPSLLVARKPVSTASSFLTCPLKNGGNAQLPPRLTASTSFP